PGRVLCLYLQAEDGIRGRNVTGVQTCALPINQRRASAPCLPIPVMDRHGADALRWFMLTSGSPWMARRVGHNALEEIVRKVLLRSEERRVGRERWAVFDQSWCNSSGSITETEE